MMTQTEEIKTVLQMKLKIVGLYEWLLDLYVLDFFVDDHWNKLPTLWRTAFDKMDPTDLGKILTGHSKRIVLPLSFLSLLQLIDKLSLPREVKSVNQILHEQTDHTRFISCNHPKMKNLFLKHVKLKKRHEISMMAELVHKVARASDCEAVVDFGSGVGHLVRMLAYKYEMHAAGIECQNKLSEEARKLDLELEYTAKKFLSASEMSRFHQPKHINMRLSTENQIKDSLWPDKFSCYGLIGLHPCGDLGPLLLRHFVYGDQVRFICVVGCCYMKLTDDGYPMSKFVKSKNSKLSFVSKEISCHAIEVYCDRLVKGDYKDLKIHAFRAALERMLVNLDPKLKHAPIHSVKHSDSMTFQGYCRLALQRINIEVPQSEETLAQAESDLQQWKRVVVLYTLRLSLAPLVETLVLLDRVLFVLEHGFSCEIHPVFNPKLSPRNHVIIGRKL